MPARKGHRRREPRRQSRNEVPQSRQSHQPLRNDPCRTSATVELDVPVHPIERFSQKRPVERVVEPAAFAIAHDSAVSDEIERLPVLLVGYAGHQHCGTHAP